MEDENEETHAKDLKRCPECGSKDYTKTWNLEKHHIYKGGKCVKRSNTTAGQWAYFNCLECGYERVSVP